MFPATVVNKCMINLINHKQIRTNSKPDVVELVKYINIVSFLHNLIILNCVSNDIRIPNKYNMHMAVFSNQIYLSVNLCTTVITYYYNSDNKEITVNIKHNDNFIISNT